VVVAAVAVAVALAGYRRMCFAVREPQLEVPHHAPRASAVLSLEEKDLILTFFFLSNSLFLYCMYSTTRAFPFHSNDSIPTWLVACQRL
jgi:hypothetical protein